MTHCRHVVADAELTKAAPGKSSCPTTYINGSHRTEVVDTSPRSYVLSSLSLLTPNRRSRSKAYQERPRYEAHIKSPSASQAAHPLLRMQAPQTKRKMEKKKKKKLFDLVLSVSESGAQLTCTKDGKNMMPEAMTGTNVSYALEALRYATGLFARLYVVQLHKEGRITDEQYQKFREETRG